MTSFVIKLRVIFLFQYRLMIAFRIFLWRYQTGSSVFSSSTVADGVVYVRSEDNYLYAIGAGRK
jgi:hypothetical protein